jgi:hypothetical protein
MASSSFSKVLAANVGYTLRPKLYSLSVNNLSKLTVVGVAVVVVVGSLTTIEEVTGALTTIAEVVGVWETITEDKRIKTDSFKDIINYI